MGRGLVKFTWGMLLVALVFASNAPAYAQGGGGATTLSGLVSDPTGGVLPGATRRSQGKRHRRDVHGGV